jgi:hypothetical protein
MAYGDQYKDTPENRERMKGNAETCAWAQGITYVVSRHKTSGQLGMMPKSQFDPAKVEIIFECSGGGRRAAEERWQEIFRKMEDWGEEV